VQRLNETEKFRCCHFSPQPTLYVTRIHCVSKNIPDIFSCNSRKHCRIFI